MSKDDATVAALAARRHARQRRGYVTTCFVTGDGEPARTAYAIEAAWHNAELPPYGTLAEAEEILKTLRLLNGLNEDGSERDGQTGK